MSIDALKIRFTADGVDDVLRDFDKIENKSKQLTSADVGKSFSQLPKSIQKAVKSAANGLSATDIGGKLGSGSLEQFQKAISDIGNTSRFTKADIKDLAVEFAKLPKNQQSAVLNFAQMNNQLANTPKELGKATKKLNQFAESIKRILKYRVIRKLLSEVGKMFGEGIKNVALYSKAMNNMDSNHANATLSELKSTIGQLANSMGSALIPVINALMPLFTSLANVILIVVNAINQFFSALSGKATFTKAKKKMDDYADSIGGAAGAAKDLKNNLIGIDELNVISESSGGGGGGSGNPLDMFEESAISEKIKGVTDALQPILTAIDNFFTSVKGKFITSIGLFALGCILAFSGNLPLGLGLMTAGAVMFGNEIVANWDSLGDEVQGQIERIGTIVGLGLMALGAIIMFACTSKFGLGLGLFVAGVTTTAISGIDWSDTENKVKTVVQNILKILGSALLVIGAIITFATPRKALGIGLMIAGAASLATAVAIDWKTLPDNISDVVNTIMGIIGTSLMAIGLILACTGHLGLGIALVIAGGLLSYQAVSTTSNALTDMVDGMCNKIESRFKTSLDAVASMWQSVSSWISSARESASQLIKNAADMTYGTTVGNITMKANGGMVSSGQFFIARENGMPEMVGTMGGQTAVANNDQIVEGIASGVYNAVVSAMAQSGGQSVTVYLDGKQIESSVRKTQQKRGATIGVGGLYNYG